MNYCEITHQDQQVEVILLSNDDGTDPTPTNILTDGQLINCIIFSNRPKHLNYILLNEHPELSRTLSENSRTLKYIQTLQVAIAFKNGF